MNGIDHKLSIVSFFLQRDENYIDVREYVIALSVVCRPAKTLETMKLAFKVHYLHLFQVLFNQWPCVCVIQEDIDRVVLFISGGLNT